MTHLRNAAVLFLLAASTAHAQSPVTGASAQAAYDAKDYPTCAQQFSELADTKVPSDSPDYNAACCYALSGDKSNAFLRLNKAVTDESTSVKDLNEDTDLVSLHSDKRWPQLIASAKAEENRRLANVKNRPLRDELLARGTKDQEARNAAINSGNSPEAWQKIAPIDHDNTEWMKQLVAKQGWPGISEVGKDGAQVAWLLVQHADADPAFQKRVLPLMEAAVAKHEAEPSLFALLTDRVLRAEGKPQRYGTQFQTGDDGTMSMQPTEDEANLDARRASVGLPSIAEYKQVLSETYHQPVK